MSANEQVSGETRIALAALLHIIRLMGAELVAGQHRDDVELLVKAIETKLKTLQPPEKTLETDFVKGIELAHGLVRQIFDDLRDKSERALLRDQLLAAPTSQIH